MNQRFVFFSIGKLLQVLSLSMVIPLIIAIGDARIYGFHPIITDVRCEGFIIAIGLSFLFGTALTFAGKPEVRGNMVREGFAIVTFGWLLLTLLGCIPLFLYLLSSYETASTLVIIRCFTDAYFEIMSGFTTTGATILSDIEVIPKGILFWRSMTHWLGGMGIVTLALVIFPAFGISAYQMFRGEVPGPSKERLLPQLRQTTSILWGVYALLTFVEVILLRFGGMSLFDSFCHAFGTLATGGFSTRNASIGSYQSSYIEWVVTIFMFLSGVNFILHYHLIFHNKFDVFRDDSEFKFYSIVLIIAIFLGTSVLTIQNLASEKTIQKSFRATTLTQPQYQERIDIEKKKISSFWSTLRHVSFQVVSVTTTTGFCTADFDMWPNSLRMILVLLMFFGGCSGSTAGGIKMVRFVVIFKAAWREVRTMIQPKLIMPLKIATKALDEKNVANIVGFFLLYIILTVGFVLAMSLLVTDFETAVTSVVATICNVGPGLAGVGPTETFAWIPIPGKWILTICMLLGRLEIYTVIIAFAPITWRR